MRSIAIFAGIALAAGEWPANKVRSRPFLSRLGQPLLKMFAHIRTIGNGADPPYLRRAAQQAGPVAIAEPDAAAAERLTRAEVELVIKPAMVGAIRATASGIDGAMIAKPRRQRGRALPIHLDEWDARGQNDQRRRAAVSGSSDARERGECNNKSSHFHGVLSDDIVIDGASSAGSSSGWHTASGDTRLRGKRIIKREPSPSLLFTSMRP